ncbi:DDE-type integrase/transposase/recombinase [Escherichia coli]
MAESLRRQLGEGLRKFSPVSYRAHGLPVSENLLEQITPVVRTRSGGSITYLRTDEGWLYLAVVIDLWSCAVKGWSMSPRMTAPATGLRCPADGAVAASGSRNVIVHTDRGSQYCSADYQALLKRHNLVVSAQ